MTTAHDSIQSLRDELRARSKQHKLIRGILYGIIISASLWIALAWGIAHAAEPVQSCISDAQLPASVDVNATAYLAQYPNDPLFQGYGPDLSAGTPSVAATDAAYVYAPETSAAFTAARQALGVCAQNAIVSPYGSILSVSPPMVVSSVTHAPIELKGHRHGKGSCPKCGHRKAS